MKKSAKSIVNTALYIDDKLMIGNTAAIDEMVKLLQTNGLVLKVVDGLQDYLSRKIKFLHHKKKGWLGQPYLLKEMSYEDSKYKTPGTTKILYCYAYS